MPGAPGKARIVLSVLFALFSLNALGQVALALLGRASDPGLLTVFQLLVGLTAAAASVGAWRLSRWAPTAAVAYGVSTATMLACMPALLSLPVEARFGIWSGAASVLLFGLAAGWYLRRLHLRGASPVAGNQRV